MARTRVPDVVRFYFKFNPAGDDRSYTCNKCNTTPKNKPSTGYINLRRHLTSCIGSDYNEKYAAACKSQDNSLGFKVVDYVSERELVIFKWLTWLVMRDMPFSEVDNDLTRELAGMKKSSLVSSRSIKTYVYQLVPLVEAVIAAELPQSFAIMFDGWKHGTTHYVAVFAVYMKDDSCKEVLIGFSPPLDEKFYTAKAHRDLLVSICDVYDRSLADIVVLTGDNCPTNKATATMLGVPLLGCACHKLNLAITQFVSEQPGAKSAIDTVSSLASKANHLKAAAALRELTDLVAIRANDTRWSSTYQMLKRFFKIEGELRQVHEVEMPRRSQLQVLRELMPTLTKFDSVMVGLQKKGVTLSSARGTVDELLEDFPELSHYLAQDASIVHSPLFESAVAKIQTERIGELSEAERSAMKGFEVPGKSPVRRAVQLDESDYYKELQERKRCKLQHSTAYQDLRYMLGTSASVERLFSSAKCVMTDRRNRLGTILFEAIMFLKTNRSFWDSRLVSEAIKRSHASEQEC